MQKTALLSIPLLLGALLYVPRVFADTCGSGRNGYTVNGASATQEEYQKCYSEGMAAMSNSGGHSTTVLYQIQIQTQLHRLINPNQPIQ